MAVKLLGIELELGDKFTLADFTKYLASFNDEKIDGKEFKRMFLFSEHPSGDYFKGLVVTIKKQKTLVTLKKETSGLKIIVKGMEKDSELMEYNFFIVNKNSLKGFYLYPSGSYSILSFCKQLGRAWKKMALLDAKATFKAIPRIEREEKFKEYYEKNYGNSLKAVPLVRPGDFAALVEELSSLKSMSIEFSEPRYVSRLFSPSKKYLQSHREFLTFKAVEEGELGKLTANIVEVITRTKPKKCTIHGEEDGVIQLINLENNIRSFETYRYDDISNKIVELELAKFESCIIFDALITRASTEPMITRKNSK
ncbi:hypothetical protein GETHPA_08140 [Geothrix rubra]|uniref:DUF4868 domain-containing protein n=1 Tax=Geothrix rubra TaxID=2927977 RepID=A0ABQ5Q4Q7_9BACT|nr:hypothetical protein [Geothrix rubra]GLH69281.1 hypothetical protein GETHPA_08140 [Geothrix rubra]